MINIKNVEQYCKDDISKIENYEQAITDKEQTWECHHRLELTLDGEFAHSKEELERLDMYYNRPYFELIFLSKSEHYRLHRQSGKPISKATRIKISKATKGENNPFYGKKHSVETKQKISDINKGKQRSAEYKSKQSLLKKGKPLSETNRMHKALAQRLIGLRYQEYKANGGYMTYNEFRSTIKKKQ